MFLLFDGAAYYPLGGIEDCVGVFGSLEEAVKAYPSGLHVDWGHIAEIRPDGTFEIVWNSYDKASK